MFVFHSFSGKVIVCLNWVHQVVTFLIVCIIEDLLPFAVGPCTRSWGMVGRTVSNQQLHTVRPA